MVKVDDVDIKTEETNHLKYVLAKVTEGKSRLEEALNTLGTSTIERLKELRESPESSDFFYLLERLHEKFGSFNLKDKYQRLEEMEYLKKEPYFARIDLANQSLPYGEKFYIGKFGFSDQKPIVTDWRAKVASIYYRYRFPQKNVSYISDDGVHQKDLLLKRTFEIDGGELVKYYNNDIQFDENEIIVEKLKKRTGGVLEDIIETIQQSQLDIIESDPRQVCIVQGCVGSGKSTVAIHKLSHIFFNFPKLITPQRSILIAKSQILVGYLSTLFPKLGIFDIKYKTVRDLLVGLVYAEELKISINLDVNTNTQDFTVERKKEIDNEVENIHETISQKINDIFSDEDSSVFGGFKYSRKSTPFENVYEVIKDLDEELNFQKEYIKENPDAVDVWFRRENIKTLRGVIRKLSRLLDDIKVRLLPQICGKMGINTKEKLGYRDTLVYVYIYSNLVGLANTQRYEYCVVDEGQDFSLLEYCFLNRLVLRGRFAIFGDLNQSIFDEGVVSWDMVSGAIEEAKSAKVFELDTNYRSTKPIVNLANNILSPYTQNYLPKSINRVGVDPVIEEFTSVDLMMEKFSSYVAEDSQNLDKSIGIICFSSDIKEYAENIVGKCNFSSEQVVKLNKDQRINYTPKGIYIMNLEDCKGLEFSKVYVLGLNLSDITDFKTAKKAFVVVTRAMNELFVFGVKS